MAKRGTTGGPRPRRVSEADLKRRSEYKSRAEIERQWQKRALYAIAALVAFSAIVLLGALAFEEIIRPRQDITTVNGEEISTGDFQNRVAFERWQVAQQIRDFYELSGGNLNAFGEQFAQQITNEINSLANPVLFGSPVLDRMEEQILLREAAEERGLEIDNDAIDRAVDEYIASIAGVSLPNPDATPTLAPTVTLTPLVSPTPTLTRTPTPTMTPDATEAALADGDGAEEDGPTPTPTEEVTPSSTPTATATLAEAEIYETVDASKDDFYDDATGGADVDRDVIRDAFEYDALVNALREDIAAEVAAAEDQAYVRHILISFNPDLPPGQAPPPTDNEKAAAQAEAQAVRDALLNGEPFADLARVHSDDTGSGAQGGDLGWASPANYVPEFQEAVETLELGVISEPVETQFGYHIIQVLDRESRPLSPTELADRQDQEFQTWLTELKANARIERREDWIDRIPGQPTYNELLGDILPRQ